MQLTTRSRRVINRIVSLTTRAAAVDKQLSQVSQPAIQTQRMRSTVTAALLAALALAVAPPAACHGPAAGVAVGPSKASSAQTRRDGGKPRLGECRELAVPTMRRAGGARPPKPRSAVRLDVPMAFQHFELEQIGHLLRRGAGVEGAGCAAGSAASDAAAGASPRVSFSLPPIAL